MAGIVSYGAYVPLFRLGKGTVGWEGPGEKPVANWDEDSLTMGVAAALDSLRGQDREPVDSLLFSTNSPPYQEKQSAPFIAGACDLKERLLATDLAHSVRGGTMSLKMAADAIQAGSARQVLVVAADSRPAQSRSSAEQTTGDGAAALLVGDRGSIATIQAHEALSHDILDTWRPTGEPFPRTWEDRFMLEEGYFRLCQAVASELMKKKGLAAKDISRLVLWSPDARRHRELATALGFDYKTQVQDPLFGVLGNTGTAYAPMLLVAALEQAKPGDRILMVNYGDGADATLFQVTPEIANLKPRRGLKGYLASKRLLPDYSTYLTWRGLLEPDPGARRPAQEGPSAAALHREREGVLRLYGAKCQQCGTVQYPPQRVCTRCHTRDKFDKVRLAEKPASIFTYSMDYISGTKDLPLVVAVINFEGGGRMVAFITDRDIKEVKVGMPLEMTYRRLFSAEGIHNYFWKAMPVRA